jgi:nitroreductase
MNDEHKLAATSYPIHDLLRVRWSSRAFADRPIEPEKIGSLLEAVRWSASSFNAQPWWLLLATRDEPDRFGQLAECMLPFNRQWAGDAPLLMLAVTRRTFEHNGEPNPHADHDLGLALGNLTVQATALDLSLHMIAGFDAEMARQSCAIPETHEPVVMLAIGYRGVPEQLDDKLRARELSSRQRKALGDFVFSGQWGEPADWLTKPESR